MVQYESMLDLLILVVGSVELDFCDTSGSDLESLLMNSRESQKP